MSTLDLPGLRVVRTQPPTPEEGLRNDVAAFLGRTVRGPLGVPVRVTSRQGYQAVFGGQRSDLATPRAVDAYFANEGEVAWVLRTGAGGTAAEAERELAGAARLALPGRRLRVVATSKGKWADGSQVRVTYRAYGPAGDPELDVRISVPGEPPVQRAGLSPGGLLEAIAATGLLRASFEGEPIAARAGGPASVEWRLELGPGEEPTAKRSEYLDAAIEQAQVDEIALVCAPDLEHDVVGEDDHDEVVAALAAAAAARQDRLLILATRLMRPDELAAWLDRMDRALPDEALRRAVAAYAPWLLCEDLTHSGIDRYVPTTPVGHVCGLIAQLDRERGSGWAPTNTLVADAIDIATPAPAAEQAFALGRQVNLLRCRPGGGLELWGARTLDTGDGRHIAHRRLLHRIVRAIRRVADPLAFDINGEVLWFMVARAISGVLMEAFRTGFLQGQTPDEAYRVRCDATTNTPDVIDAGQVVCEIEVAPAAPMEFITLRLTLGAQGLLEVVEQ